MLKFLLRRLVNYLVLTGIATVLGFFLASSALNPRSNYEGRNPPIPEASVDRILDGLNMNDKTPIAKRFAVWAGGVARGEFGRTIGGQPISAEMGRRIGVSLRLLLIGSVLGAVTGVAVGVWGAVRHRKFSDNAMTAASFVVLSTPVFLLAVLLKLGAFTLNETVGATVLYNTGEVTPGLAGGPMAVLMNRLQHLALPTLSIVMGGAAGYSRYQRSTMLDVMGSDFLRTAQAKGLRRRTALVKHGLRTALIPMATFFAYGFGLLITGAAFTEKIFAWHGMGEWAIDAVFNNDINVVVAVTAFNAVLILIAGMLSDLLTAALDPRVRVS
jgi:peptide/nickel transport system permease protein